ncbi:MAG: redoxin domain-containing protein [Sedimentisphaerales bacterium]|nr:redoxin domain-containing protein [Sedimentisphaerales bacterium]
MSRNYVILFNLFCISFLIVVLPGTGMIQQTSARQANDEVISETCTLSGKVINYDTNEPVPNFCLAYLKSNGAHIAYLKTDENGNFRTTAQKNSERSFRYDFSRDGTYIIDPQRQDSYVPFRGKITEDITNLLFKVKLWPVKTLHGKVLDESSRVVSNASVYFHSDIPEIKTDESGAFKLHAAPTDRDFDFFIISEDRKHAKMVHAKAGSTTAAINLEPAENYKGRVVNTKNQPVWPFKFRIGLMINGDDLNFCWSEEIQTDTDGTFTIDGLYPKTSYVAQWFPDEEFNSSIGEYGKKTIDLTKLKSDGYFEIVVVQYLNTLTGKVVDINNVPIEGANFIVGTRDGIQSQSGWGKPFYSDKDGRFSIRNLADGQVYFHASKKGYKFKDTWASTDSNDIKIVLEPLSDTSICEIHVVDDEYKPVSNASVKLDFIVTDTLLYTKTVKTNVEGKVEFEIKDYGGDDIIALGIVSCDMNGYDLAYNTIVDYRNSQVKLVLHKAGENWSGKIVDSEQKPIKAAKIYLVSIRQRVKTPQRNEIQSLDQSFFSDPFEATLITQTDTNGDFTLRRFNKKDFVRIAVKAPGFKTQEIDFSPEDNTATILSSPRFKTVKDFVFQLSSGVAIVKGILIEEFSGKPISNANIGLRDEINKDRNITTDEDGTFSIEDLEPGEYVPVFNAAENSNYSNYVCVPDTFIAVPDKTIQVTFKACEGISVNGSLIESQTQQRPSAERVYLDARLKTGHTISSCLIEKDGSWQMLLPPGDYEFYYSILLEDISRFIDSEEPLSIKIEKEQMYSNMVLAINENGSLILQSISLVGKSLPDLKYFGTESQPDINNKKVLVCFFDLEQRPSRNLIQELNKKAQDIKEKGIEIIAINTSKIEREYLDNWLIENNVDFPVGINKENIEQTKFNWGVKALPWLILTDKEHVVTDEGFAVAELDEHIK